MVIFSFDFEFEEKIHRMIPLSTKKQHFFYPKHTNFWVKSVGYDWNCNNV